MSTFVNIKKNNRGTSELGVDELYSNQFLSLASLTTTQRNSLTPNNGYLIYNNTDHAMNIYENGSWIEVSAGTDTSKWGFTADASSIFRATKVGIGDTFSSGGTDPSTSLHVKNAATANIRVEGGSSNTCNLRLYRGGTNNWAVGMGTSGDNLSFVYNSSEIFRMQSSNNAFIAPSIHMSGTTGTIRLNSMTTTQRNALTPTNGDIIYNSTDNQFEGYENGSWVEFGAGSSDISKWTLKSSDIYRNSVVGIGDWSSNSFPSGSKLAIESSIAIMTIRDTSQSTYYRLEASSTPTVKSLFISPDATTLGIGIHDSGQVTIGAVNSVTSASIGLNLNSTDKIMKFDVLTKTQRDNLSTVVNGMCCYNSTDHALEIYANGAWYSLNGTANP